LNEFGDLAPISDADFCKLVPNDDDDDSGDDDDGDVDDVDVEVARHWKISVALVDRVGVVTTAAAAAAAALVLGVAEVVTVVVPLWSGDDCSRARCSSSCCFRCSRFSNACCCSRVGALVNSGDSLRGGVAVSNES
jgi:hypothetical protein